MLKGFTPRTSLGFEALNIESIGIHAGNVTNILGNARAIVPSAAVISAVQTASTAKPVEQVRPTASLAGGPSTTGLQN